MISVLKLIEMSRIIESWQEDFNSDCAIGIYYALRIKGKLKEAKQEIDECITAMEGFR